MILTTLSLSLGLILADGEAERSLSLPSNTSTGSSSVEGRPVSGSQLLFMTYAPKGPDSATSYMMKNILEVEKLMGGVKQDDRQIKAKDPALRKFISSVLDLDTLGRNALATYWDELGKTSDGKKKRETYLTTFKKLVEENYMEKIRVYVGGNYRITLTGEQPNKRGTSVNAMIKKKDADVMVEFQLQKKDGNWAIIDTKLDDTSLEEAYRGSFNRIVKKHGGLQKGFPELIRVMEKRLEELKKGKATKI